MASAAAPAVVDRLPLSRWKDLVLPLGIIASVLVMLVPLPAHLMDVLLSANIAIAVIVLLTTIYVRTPTEFSVFPSVLLATTLGRLVLNIAVTRLILTQAQTKGLMAAGGVVRSFGEFVAGDRLVVGIIIFAIIVVIQFVVITKGATRISEVAARFALDGMPGRQMAIDADLNAGMIDEKQAQRRRREVTEQADFFGAMDGASKFVRGDAIAGIVITLVNIVGGLVIGVGQSGMSLSEAGSVYTKLTIGDGLVSQVPAFLISLAAGLLVTRSSRESNLPREFLDQLFSRPQALGVAGAFIAILTFTSLPRVPLLLIGGSCLGLAYMLTRRDQAGAAALAAKTRVESQKPERVENYLAVDPMEIEIGAGLIRLADPKRGGDLLERIQRVRQQIAAEIGILVPKVRIRDNLRLAQNEYRIKIADLAVAQGTVYSGLLLAIESGAATGPLEGLEARDPASDARATWIEPSARANAEMLGYRVIEPTSVLSGHLTEVVRRHADEILTRDATRHLIDELKQSQPAVVEELIPGQMKLAEVQQILQMLLHEQVPIRQLGPILETLGDFASRTKDPELLVEYVRRRLARTLSARHRSADGKLHVATLDPGLEDRIRAGLEHNDGGLFVRLSPIVVERTVGLIAEAVDALARAGHPPVVLASPQVRAGLKKMTEHALPRLAVLSYDEITRDTPIESAALINDP